MSEIKEVFDKMHIELPDGALELLNRYYEMLIDTNKVMNLTTITEYSEVVIKHFADSAAIGCITDMNGNIDVIDVGTGAGFPGIVLKIVYPQLSVVLLDSLNKRVNFLKNVITELGLTDISAIHGRAEDIARNKDYREKFDLCVSRAVANMSSLSEYCLPFVKVGGRFIPYKADGCDEEVKTASKAVNTLGGKIRKIESYVIPDTDICRKFVVIDKLRNTSAKYPRKAGLPTKEPLV
ncbi:MAG TPA: 16S rRNA (guanine(527)-N(7))-methyltransferase RsmG [Lachnospiraceae bacterium]|nr:16S rRNA (guanine(527)-N(7))-methyltransferase RsmG [Lachnospiraceae bacterium]